jgi:hypothetical protein
LHSWHISYANLLWLTPPDGHQQRVQRQLPIDPGSHRPADHLAREQIQNGCEIQPTLMSADVRDIGDSDFVWLGNVELAL